MNKKKSIAICSIAYLLGLLLFILSFVYFKHYFNLLISTLLADIVYTIVIFIFSIVLNNSSVYDPYWSLVPAFIYIIWVVNIAQRIDPAIVIIGFVILLWGYRLTRNWLINFKGFSLEDWRYVQFRNKFKSLYWVVSFLGIHLFPTLIVFSTMLPIYYGLKNYTNVNYVLLLGGCLIGITSVAISYYSDKHLLEHRKHNSKEAVQSGLWKYSRHPNYFGEILFWFSVLVMGISLNITVYFTGLGWIAMVLLFQLYSIPAMEAKLLKNKENYQEVIKTTSRLVPYKKKVSE